MSPDSGLCKLLGFELYYFLQKVFVVVSPYVRMDRQSLYLRSPESGLPTPDSGLRTPDYRFPSPES